METPPENYTNIDYDFCSNFDGAIDTTVAERLKTEHITADYPAWEFHGTVWYQDKKYLCKIMRYRCHVATIKGDTPNELKENVCEKFGYN